MCDKKESKGVAIPICRNQRECKRYWGRDGGSSKEQTRTWPLCGHRQLAAHLQSHNAVVRYHEDFVAPVGRPLWVLVGIWGAVSVVHRLQGLSSILSRRGLAELIVLVVPILLLLLLICVILEHRRGVHRGRWSISEETLEVVALYDLGHCTRLHMPDLHERGLKCKDIWILKC